VGKIRRLIGLDWVVMVKHLYHQANQCANVLANIGCGMPNGCVIFYEGSKLQSCFSGRFFLEIVTPRLVLS
jgi:hypothetical protein